MGKEIGIDFGTTTTEVSYIDKNGHARAMKLEGGRDVIPTVLYFLSEENWIIGKNASTRSRIHPEACVKNFKLFFTDPLKKYKVIAENEDEFTIKPVQAAQYYLNSLIQIVQPKLIKEFGEIEGVIDKAVITAPALFDEFKRSAIKDALMKSGEKAGFNDIKIATEPTAAAVAYQEENCEDGETILVYDFGGGTFDVSIIQKNGDVFKEINTSGDSTLGGNLLTEKIAEVLWVNCLDFVNREYPFDEHEADYYSEADYELEKIKFIQNRNAVFNAAEDIKIDFLEEDEINVQIPFYYDNECDPALVDITMEIEDFNDIIRDDVEHTIELTKKVLNRTIESGKVAEINQVVLAGGSSQLRLVKELLSEESELKNLVGNGEDSSTLISRGAAKLASIELKVEEKTRFEIGTRVVKGTSLNEFETIIGVGEQLPCKGEHIFYLNREGQDEVTIEYFEKDANNYPNATSIYDEGINLVGELKITGIPRQDGLSLKVIFNVEKDGTPTINAEILDTNGNTVKADQLSVKKGGNLY